MAFTEIDNALYKLHKVAEETDDIYAIWGEYAIRRYVLTGRASTPWVNALLKANPSRLLARISKARAGADKDAMDITHKYLMRYCGLQQTPIGG